MPDDRQHQDPPEGTGPADATGGSQVVAPAGVPPAKPDPPPPARHGGIGRVKAALLAAVLVATVVWSLAGPTYSVYMTNLIMLSAMGAIALTILTGWAGQISVGNAAFLAVGGYTAALLSDHLPMLATIAVAGIVTAGVGSLVGLLGLRMRGIYLIFATLALHFITNAALVAYDNGTGHQQGHFLATRNLFGIRMYGDHTWALVILVFLAATIVLARNLGRGRPGRAWRAVRAHEVAASTVGVHVPTLRLHAFAVSSLIIGVQGALLAYYTQQVSYTYYTLPLAISYLAMIIIGGRGSIGGSIAGAAIVTALPFIITNVNESVGSSAIQANGAAVDLIVYSVILLVFLIWRPGGIAALWNTRTAGTRRGIGSGRRAHAEERP